MKTIRIGDGRQVLARDDVEIRRVPPGASADRPTMTARPFGFGEESHLVAAPQRAIGGGMTEPHTVGGCYQRRSPH